MKRITNHMRANTVGYLALFFALSAGAYAAALGPNSVKSKHIKDGHVRSADIAADAVTGSHVANAGLGGGDLAPNSIGSQQVSDLSGNDLASNSIGGEQVNESTLGEVPNATIAGHGGYGRSGAPASCDPTDALYFTCASVTLNPSAPARFLVTATFTARTDGSDEGDLGTGSCRLGSSTSGGIPDTTHSLSLFSPKDGWYGSEARTITAITNEYQPGNYTFGLDCLENAGGIQIAGARVTAVAISPF